MLDSLSQVAVNQISLAEAFQNVEKKRKTWEATSAEAKLRDDLLCKVFMSTGMSTRLLDNADLRRYLETVDGKYCLPGSKKMNRLLEDSMTEITEGMKKDLQKASRLTLTMDCWSKKSLTASFLAISVAFFSPLKCFPVHLLLQLHQIQHPHTGEAISDKLLETLEKWGIDRGKILMMITDNGSNMIKAIRCINESAVDSIDDEENDDDSDSGDSDEEDNTEDINELDQIVGLHRLPCIAHTLQLVVKELNNISSHVNLVTKVKDLVAFVRKSSVLQEQLFKASGTVLRTSCPTRWNSMYMMIERVLQVRPHLEEVLKNERKDSLTNTEWARLGELQEVLGPFREQTNYLQTDTLSLSSIIPSIVELSLHLKKKNLPKTLTNPLHAALTKRFENFLDPASPSFDPLPGAASFLDPEFTAVMSKPELESILLASKSYIRLQVLKSRNSNLVEATSTTPSTSMSTSPPVSQPSLKRYKLLAETIDVEAVHQESDVDSEISSFASFVKANPAGDQSSIDYWKERKSSFPLLSGLAFDLLSAPASEAYVERVFSVCTDITTGKRNRLTKKLNTRVFLKMNRKYL